MRQRMSVPAWIGGFALAVLCASCAQSDAGITTKVKSKLEADRSVPSAASIQVATSGNVVTLTGTASSPAEKEKAVSLARSTEGVKDVVDNLSINPSAAPAEPPPAASPGAEPASPDAASPSPAAPAVPTAAPKP